MKRYMKIFWLALPVLMALWSGGGCGKSGADKCRIVFKGPKEMTLACGGKTVSGESTAVLLRPNRDYLMKFSAPGFRDKWNSFRFAPGDKLAVKVAMREQFGMALVDSEPSGATVEVGGRNLGITPLVLRNLRCGEHYGTLKLPGYADCTVRWKITDARPQAVKGILETNTGTLNVTSVPAGARVLLDGREVGAAELTLERPAGKYRLRVELPGYIAADDYVELKRNQELRRQYTLLPMPGRLRIVTNPAGAEVFVNGEKIGVSPCESGDLAAGNYQIRVVCQGFDPAEETLRLTAGSVEKREFKLLSSSGNIRIFARPAGVTVLLDGEMLGETVAKKDSISDTEPIMVSGVAPGRHIVTLTHPRSDPGSVRLEVVVAKGTTALIDEHLWVANCELYYKNGVVERGVIYADNPEYVLFGPEPRVQIKIMRSLLLRVKYLK